MLHVIYLYNTLEEGRQRDRKNYWLFGVTIGEGAQKGHMRTSWGDVALTYIVSLAPLQLRHRHQGPRKVPQATVDFSITIVLPFPDFLLMQLRTCHVVCAPGVQSVGLYC